MVTLVHTDNHTETNTELQPVKLVNLERIPLPRGEVKALAAKLHCHPNAIYKGWKRFDPVWIANIREHAEEVRQNRLNAMKAARELVQRNLRSMKTVRRELEKMTNFLKKEL